ncbi:hypothetical protein LINGRAHAP2_LOCUS554, partial [Linum grandiflorum]
FPCDSNNISCLLIDLQCSGRLLDPHRSRLHHKTFEALMCTKTWLQDDLKKGN